jgi:hypothetical protein
MMATLSSAAITAPIISLSETLLPTHAASAALAKTGALSMQPNANEAAVTIPASSMACKNKTKQKRVGRKQGSVSEKERGGRK